MTLYTLQHQAGLAVTLGPRTLLTTCTHLLHSEVTQDDVDNFFSQKYFPSDCKNISRQKAKIFPASSNSALQGHTLEAVLQGGVRVPVTLLTQHQDSGLCLVTLDAADTEGLDGKKETAPLLVPA